LIVRIAQWVLRLCVGLALILGILFWTDHAADSLVLVHLCLGILVVLSLWTLGVAQALTKGGSWGLAIGAVVFGLILAASGGIQDELLTGSWHWIIQVVHLLLGLSALGLGERIGRHSRGRSVPALPSPST
jgi:hypothetical protein